MTSKGKKPPQTKEQCDCHCHCKLHEGGKRFLHTSAFTIRSCEHCKPTQTREEKI